MTVLLFARRSNKRGTAVMTTSVDEAVKILKEKRGVDYELGVLMGSSVRNIKIGYAEYSPLIEVDDLEDLLEFVGDSEKKAKKEGD